MWPVDPEDASQLRGPAHTVVATAGQFALESCGSAAECFQRTRDVAEAV